MVYKLAVHGMETEAQHARDTLWLAAHEVLVRSSDNALIKSRGALMISTLRANGWAELEELASGLRAG